MSRKCSVTNKKGKVGNNVSHSKRRTKRVQEVNLQWKRFWVPELSRWVRLRVSTSAIRSVAKHGAAKVLSKAGLISLKPKKKKEKVKA